jgi:hypothetical protein
LGIAADLGAALAVPLDGGPDFGIAPDRGGAMFPDFGAVLAGTFFGGAAGTPLISRNRDRARDRIVPIVLTGNSSSVLISS